MRRLRAVAVALLLCCVLIAAGCGHAETTTTYLIDEGVATTSEAPTAPATSTETNSTESTASDTAHLYPVEVGGKWGFIDSTGAIKIEPRFDGVRRNDHQYYGVDYFSDGLAAVSVTVDGTEKWGYIDRSGAMVIDPQFDVAWTFSEGLAVVGNKTGLDGWKYMEFGYIDTSGDLVIPMERNSASSFSESLAVFFAEDFYPAYFIDTEGATVLGPYDFALDFSEGLAYVEWGDRCGYIDKTGDWVIELADGYGRSQHCSCCFSEGLASVAACDGEAEGHGVVDTSGTLVIEPRFFALGDFSEGLAMAMVEVKGELECGYIDKTGAWVVDPQYDWAGDFSEGLAAVGYFDDDAMTYGYIARTGTMVIPPRRCWWAEPFFGGVAALTGLEDGDPQTPSYVDKTGNVIWQGE